MTNIIQKYDKKLLVWVIFIALAVVGLSIAFVVEQSPAPMEMLVVWAVLVMGVVLPFYVFFYDVYCRSWLRKRTVAQGNGVVYVVNAVPLVQRLTYVLRSQADSDVLGRVSYCLLRIMGGSLDYPYPVIVIIEDACTPRECRYRLSPLWSLRSINYIRMSWNGFMGELVAGMAREIGHRILEYNGLYDVRGEVIKLTNVDQALVPRDKEQKHHGD